MISPRTQAIKNFPLEQGFLFVRPAICSLQQRPNMVNLSCVIKIMRNHNSNNIARGQPFAPIGEAVLRQFCIVGKRLNGVQPALMTFCQPGEQLNMRARSYSSCWEEWRLVTAHRGRTESVILI